VRLSWVGNEWRRPCALDFTTQPAGAMFSRDPKSVRACLTLPATS
jgi:hypothetical protein